MIGKIFITSSGYDPQLGKHVKDPYLGPNPSLGACRPDVRERIKIGGHIFVISGKLPNVSQYVIGGFEVAAKIDAREAFRRFPEQRLHLRDDGQLAGNVIVDADGVQHPLDDHTSFSRRISNYIVGTNGVSMETQQEIALAREETLETLREIFDKKQAALPCGVVGHFGLNLTDTQVFRLQEWLLSLKNHA